MMSCLFCINYHVLHIGRWRGHLGADSVVVLQQHTHVPGRDCPLAPGARHWGDAVGGGGGGGGGEILQVWLGVGDGFHQVVEQVWRARRWCSRGTDVRHRPQGGSQEQPYRGGPHLCPLKKPGPAADQFLMGIRHFTHSHFTGREKDSFSIFIHLFSYI